MGRPNTMNFAQLGTAEDATAANRNRNRNLNWNQRARRANSGRMKTNWRLSFGASGKSVQDVAQLRNRWKRVSSVAQEKATVELSTDGEPPV